MAINVDIEVGRTELFLFAITAAGLLAVVATSIFRDTIRCDGRLIRESENTYRCIEKEPEA